jgi:hypothetical protein
LGGVHTANYLVHLMSGLEEAGLSTRPQPRQRTTSWGSRTSIDRLPGRCRNYWGGKTPA